jgi:hypothetical protein
MAGLHLLYLSGGNMIFIDKPMSAHGAAPAAPLLSKRGLRQAVVTFLSSHRMKKLGRA